MGVLNSKFPDGIYLFKVNNENIRNLLVEINNENIRIMCQICSKLAVKIPERRHWRHSSISTVNFQQNSHIVLVFPLLALNN